MLFIGVNLHISPVFAQDILFDFDNAPFYTSLPTFFKPPAVLLLIFRQRDIQYRMQTCSVLQRRDYQSIFYILTAFISRISEFILTSQEVTELVNGIEQPGFKTVNFNAGSLSSEVYYYTLLCRKFYRNEKAVFFVFISILMQA